MSSLTLPSASEIEALHRKYAPTESVFELVFTHCKIVSDIATQLAEKSGANVDIELVRVGCLLHDIGVYPLFDKNGVEIDTSKYITFLQNRPKLICKTPPDEDRCNSGSYEKYFSR